MQQILRTIIQNIGSYSAMWVLLEYESQRSGNDQQYRFHYKVWLGNRTDGSTSGVNAVWGYTVSNTIGLDGTTLSGYPGSKSHTASNVNWTDDYETSNWFTVSNKTSGTVPITLTVNKGDGSTNYTWNNTLPVDPMPEPIEEETNVMLGNIPIKKLYLGNNLISAMWLGLKKIFPREVIPSWRDRYQEVEYIESTGTQHITIDYFLDNQCSVEYKALFKNKTTTPVYEAIFSNGTYSSSFFYNTIPNDKNKFSYFKKQTDMSPCYGFSVTYNKIYRINNDYKNNKLYVYDENNTNLYTYTLTYTSITARTNKLSIFSENGTEKTMLMQLYSFVISKNGDDVINLVPVYRRSDNKPGMYDVVNDTFYINQGSGEFTYGPEVYTEDDFVKVEYLESSGTQYINTLIKIQDNKTECEMRFKVVDRSKWQYLYGEYYNSGTSTTSYHLHCVNWSSNSGNGNVTAWVGDYVGQYNVDIKPISDDIHIVKTTYNTDGSSVYFDDTLVTSTLRSNSYHTHNNAYLFTTNVNGRTGNMSYFRCYYFKITKNDILTLNLIPVKRKGDNKPGMFDKVNNKFYVNSGTGEFAVGPDVN